MKTFNFDGNAGKGGLAPRVAGALSVIPGLGQLYNGERLKGWLFLEVGILNFSILLLILCADSICSGMAQFAVDHRFVANTSLLKTLGGFKLGHPGATLLFTLCLSFIAFSIRDAYDKAVQIRHREIYSGHFLELSEATSGSYLAHFALMSALLILSVFLLIPAPERTQITEIEFITQNAEHRIKPVETKRISSTNARAQGAHRRDMPVRPKVGEANPAQPKIARNAEKPAVRPVQHSQSQTSHQHSQITPVQKRAAETESQPAPQPVPFKPSVMPKPTAPAPAPLPAVRPVAPAIHVPAPLQSKDSGSSGAIAKPLLAFNPTSSAATSAVPQIASINIGRGSNSAAPSWMSGKSAANSSNSSTAAPSVDSKSFSGVGSNNVKPTLAESSTNSPGMGKGKANNAPEPMSAKTGPGARSLINIVPHSGAPVGTPSGGRENTVPNATEGRTQIPTNNPSPKFEEYLANLQRRIRRAWIPPHQPTSKSTVVIFTIGVDGQLLGLRMQRSSGDSAMDSAAMQSIKNSAPFPHLPQYATESVDVQFTFDYNVFNGGRQF